MTAATRALVRLSAAIRAGDRVRLERAIDVAARECDDRAAEEAIVQSYLFLGYPAALNTMGLWRARTGHPPSGLSGDDPAKWPERGAEVFRIVYGEQDRRLLENVTALHPELAEWMLTEGYGKVLGRSGLGLPERELRIVAILAGLDAAPQLHSHLRGALNAGAAVDDVAAALEAGCEDVDAGRAAEARRIWEDVRARWEQRVT